ncbi:DUF378 domain-containing protein [Candidatus Parcubacteria bacterium]|nr:DUF378 domain-containing protein [Candidatus Parcubacteria bacterium]
MKAVHAIAFVLVVVGAVNWGLVGIGGWNVVHSLLGSVSSLERIVYVLVGLSGVYLAVTHGKNCKTCESSAPQAAM